MEPFIITVTISGAYVLTFLFCYSGVKLLSLCMYMFNLNIECQEVFSVVELICMPSTIYESSCVSISSPTLNIKLRLYNFRHSGWLYSEFHFGFSLNLPDY